LKPRQAPINTNGVNMQNQRASNTKNVGHEIAAELSFPQRTIFKPNKITKIKLK